MGKNNRSIPKVSITVDTGDAVSVIGLDDLLAAFGIHGDPDTVALTVTQDGVSLKATTEPKETEYPNITVDAYDAAGEEIYLGNFELPCESMPDGIAARLYAGYAALETDSPIAIVKHKLRSQADLAEKQNWYQKSHSGPVKLVHVDMELAHARNWNGTSIQEHEDYGDW